MEKLLILLGICIGAVATLFLFRYLEKKGINTETIIKDTETSLKTAEGYTKAAVSLTTGKAKKGLSIIATIEGLAEKACGYAWQLYISQQIKDDADGSKRRKTALDWIYIALEKIGITVDNSVKTIATGIVENTVLSDKTIGQINKQLDKLIEDRVATLQKEKEEIQSKLNSTTNELTTVKTQLLTAQNKLATARNIFSPIQNTAETVKSTLDESKDTSNVVDTKQQEESVTSVQSTEGTGSTVQDTQPAQNNTAVESNTTPQA